MSDHYTADIQGQVVVRDRRVHVLFSREVEGQLRPAETDNLQLDPPAALAMAELLIDMAFEADAGLKPVGPALKASLVEKHRKKLLPRLTLIIKSRREVSTVSHAELARILLDAVFNEVFT